MHTAQLTLREFLGNFADLGWGGEDCESPFCNIFCIYNANNMIVVHIYGHNISVGFGSF